MATEAQIAANRRNAELSTGPRTDAGKNASKLNAVTHGLSAEIAVLPTEDPKEYARFRETLLESLAPVGALEERLAEEVVEGSWRLRRASISSSAYLFAVSRMQTSNTSSHAEDCLS